MTMEQQSREVWGCLLGPNEVLVAESVVTDEEQGRLVEWLDAQRRGGKLVNNPQDLGAYSTPFRSSSGDLTRLTRGGSRSGGGSAQKLVWIPDVEREVDPLPDEVWRIRARVVDQLGLHGLEEDHYKGSFMSYIEPGTGVHQHRDDRLKAGTEALLILRCNVLFRKPEGGGTPVFDARKEVDVPDRGMWAFFPTEVVHSATEVRGARFRGLLSFGFLVRVADLWRRCFRISQGFVSEYALDSGEDARGAVLASLRSSAPASGISDERLELLAFVMSSTGDFSVEEAARSLGRHPSEIWEVLRDLQRSGLVESRSSTRSERGKVVVL